jgi:hypothetical protein
LSKAVGTANDQADKNQYQVLTDLNLDKWRGSSNVDRRHILSLGAQTEIPKTGGVTLFSTARYMSGAPFTIFDSSIDADRNGELVDPVPAGTYSGTAPDSMKNVEYKGGRNGAIGPDYFQIDVRAGWRRKIRAKKALEVFLDIYNITNRANFDNPVTANSDRRTPATFLVLTNLRGGGGFPRQAEMGFRLVFLSANWALSAIRQDVLGINLPRLHKLQLDGVTWLFALGMTAVSAIALVAVPASLSIRQVQSDDLNADFRQAATRQGTLATTWQTTMVAAEMAVAVMLLIAGGLLFKSLSRLQRVDPGFEARVVLTFQLSVPYSQPRQIGTFYDELMRRLSALPGVQAHITEYQCPPVVCPACGKTTQAPLPDEIEGQFGPQLTALIAYLTVVCRLPRLVVQRLLEGALQIPISVGSTQKAGKKRVPPSPGRARNSSGRCPRSRCSTAMKPGTAPTARSAGSGRSWRRRLSSIRLPRPVAPTCCDACWARPFPASSAVTACRRT